MPVSSPESTTIKLPRAVLERSQRIQRMIEDRRQASEKPQADPPPNPEPTPTAPIAAPAPTTPDRSASTASGLPPGDPRENDVGYWRQRAKAVFGMFERSREDLQAERAKNRELRDQLATKEASAPAAEPAINLETLFSPQEREQYGDEQLQLIARTAARLGTAQAQELVSKATKPLQDRIDEDKQSESQRKWDDFSHRLVALCPDAFEIDKTPEWGTWLQNVDEVSGVTYYQQLKAHESRMDASGVARLFNRYKAESLGIAAPPAAPAAPAPKPPVAPRTGGGHGGGDMPQARAVLPPTKAEIRGFYKRAALNRVTDAERAEFEARLAAQPA